MVTQPKRSTAAFLVAISLVVIGFFTLRPEVPSVVLPTTCVFCGELGGTDFVLNVILFVPLGASMRWLTRQQLSAVALGLGTTVLIEALQLGVIPGRYASLGDLIANTLGAVVGVWLAVQLIAFLNNTSARARALSTPCAGVLGIVVFATAMLIQPSLPTKRYLDVQWTPVRRNTVPFPGRLLSVSLNDHPLRTGQRIYSYWLLDSLNRSVEVRARVTSGGTPQRRAIIVRTANPTEEGFLLAQDGEQIVFRARVFAERFKLRPLEISLTRGLQPAVGSDRVREIVALSSPLAMSLISEHPTGKHEVTLNRTAGLGWTLFSPYEVAIGPSWWVANAIWLGALVMPLAFLVKRAARKDDAFPNPRVPWGPSAFLLASLVFWPMVFGLSPLGLGESFGVAVGIMVGILIERWTRLHRVVTSSADTRTPQPELR